MPMAVYPYLLALCVIMTLLSWLAEQRASTWALLCILAAYGVMQVNGAVFGHGSLHLAASAMIWAAVSSAVFRAGNSTSAGIVAMAATCYFWANLSGAPRVFGSPPFVASDVLMAIAIIGIGWHGVRSLHGRICGVGALGVGSQRRIDGFGVKMAPQKARPSR